MFRKTSTPKKQKNNGFPKTILAGSSGEVGNSSASVSLADNPEIVGEEFKLLNLVQQLLNLGEDLLKLVEDLLKNLGEDLLNIGEVLLNVGEQLLKLW